MFLQKACQSRYETGQLVRRDTHLAQTGEHLGGCPCTAKATGYLGNPAQKASQGIGILGLLLGSERLFEPAASHGNPVEDGIERPGLQLAAQKLESNTGSGLGDIHGNTEALSQSGNNLRSGRIVDSHRIPELEVTADPTRLGQHCVPAMPEWMGCTDCWAVSPAPIQIFACQNRTCRRDGSGAVLEMLRQEIAAHGLTERIDLQQTGCLGQCGNGPMLIVVQPETGEEVWYDRMRAEEVPLLVSQHLIDGQPLVDMLYRARHPKHSSPAWTALPPPWHQTPSSHSTERD